MKAGENQIKKMKEKQSSARNNEKKNQRRNENGEK